MKRNSFTVWQMNTGCIMVAKFRPKQNNSWNIWNNYTRYSVERKSGLLNTELIICFEYILLEFKELIEWIYAPDDEFLVKREKAITAREKLVKTIQSGEINYKDIREIIEYNENVDDYNVEQLSARILFDLTRNTGFEVSKGSVGECWIKSCCEWEERMPDDICGLDVSRLSVKEKMKRICKGTSLLKQFQNMGLEVAL